MSVCLFLCTHAQESVEMRKMETSISSTIPLPGASLENQGRAASMPRLTAEMQVNVSSLSQHISAAF